MTERRDLDALAEARALSAALDRSFRVEALRIGPGALDAVPSELRRMSIDPGASVVVLADDVPHAAPSGTVTQGVIGVLVEAGHCCRLVTISGDGHAGHESRVVHASEDVVEAATGACRPADVIVSVGSGTITDIGKIVAARLGTSHLVVQTAASVNGFTSNQSVLLVDGAKRTVLSRWPDAVMIDTDVVGLAPPAMNAAGVGDLLAMFTAPADWLVASTFGTGARYEPAIVDLFLPHAPYLLEIAPRVAAGEPAALADLADLLSLTGFAIGLAGTTAPSSGFEHLVSHVLEMRTVADEGTPSLHGQQVGIGAIVASAIWSRLVEFTGGRRLAEIRLPERADSRAPVLEAFAVLGAATAEECWSAYERKLIALGGQQRDQTRWRVLRDSWPDLCGQLSGLLQPPAVVRDALWAAGGPTSFAELPSRVDAETARWAIVHGHRMRDRFVVTDLAELIGLWNDEFIDVVIDDLVGLGVFG